MKQANARTAEKARGDLERRSRLIHDRPLVLGASWAVDACQAAVLSGRKLEGGWPGTVPEARTRVSQELTRALTELGMSTLSHDELVTATSLAYERAKRDWQLAAKARRGVAAISRADSDVNGTQSKLP
jgi:hypothetical protein